MINGTFEPTTEERINGELVYRNKDAPDYWLELTLYNGTLKWYLKSTQYRGAANSTSYAYCDVIRHQANGNNNGHNNQDDNGLSNCLPGSWRVSTGNGFEEQAYVTISRVLD
jgi:hypothetical protein